MSASRRKAADIKLLTNDEFSLLGQELRHTHLRLGLNQVNLIPDIPDGWENDVDFLTAYNCLETAVKAYFEYSDLLAEMRTARATTSESDELKDVATSIKTLALMRHVI